MRMTGRTIIKTILVTGGAGYIGSHVCVELLDAGLDVIVVDNLSNSSQQALNRVEKITAKTVEFYQIDLRDKAAVKTVFEVHAIDAVIHLAGLKAVGESCELPLKYYQNNISSTLVLLELLEQFSVRNIVFSSSATVYGDPTTVPVSEQLPLTATNPYGRTKLMIEEMLRDVANASPLQAVLLRYFNPVGAHESGLIGEDPNGIPNNLLPYVSQVAMGQRDKVSIFGGDYPTIDGTGVRDYIHVVDLAKGHVKALQGMAKKWSKGENCQVYNLGTGQGYSVIEVINAFEQACGHKIAYEIVERRLGDIAECYADPSLANQELNWQAEKSLAEMMSDAWRWQSQNPNGYKDD
ncbi:MAG: UDP-glucose 4-epimerase [Candidatus Endobugula sp.]|jgi:UDP-glucose 4-epimerase